MKKEIILTLGSAGKNVSDYLYTRVNDYEYINIDRKNLATYNYRYFHIHRQTLENREEFKVWFIDNFDDDIKAIICAFNGDISNIILRHLVELDMIKTTKVIGIYPFPFEGKREMGIALELSRYLKNSGVNVINIDNSQYIGDEDISLLEVSLNINRQIKQYISKQPPQNKEISSKDTKVIKAITQNISNSNNKRDLMIASIISFIIGVTVTILVILSIGYI